MRFNKCLIGLCAGMLATSAANAAIVTQFGTNVKFTYDDSTLFGTGTVVGNNIFFTPDNFLASSLGGAGPVVVTDFLEIVIEATSPGYTMNKLRLHESGDYFTDGSGASVSADADFEVESNTTLCGGSLCNEMNSYSAGPLANTGGNFAFWQLGGLVDLGDTTGWESDSALTVTLTNSLMADSLSSTDDAFIQKKNGAIGIQVVPVPAAVWLFLSGLLGVIGVGRRNS